MQKVTAEKIAKVLPDTLKNAAGYFKSNFDKSGQETLTNATGSDARSTDDGIDWLWFRGCVGDCYITLSTTTWH